MKKPQIKLTTVLGAASYFCIAFIFPDNDLFVSRTTLYKILIALPLYFIVDYAMSYFIKENRITKQTDK